MNLLPVLLLSMLMAWTASADIASLSRGDTYYKVKDRGADKNLVFIHDDLFSSWTWKLTAPALARRGFNTLVFDLYGMGKSDRLNTFKYDRGLYLKQLDELLSHVGWSNRDIYLVGTGTGASLAVQMANNDSRVKKVVMMSPAFDYRSSRGEFGAYVLDLVRNNSNSSFVRRIVRRRLVREVDNYLALIPENQRASIRRNIENEINEDDYIDQFMRRIRGDLYSSFAPEFRNFKRTQTPGLLLAGEEDSKLPRRHVREILENQNIESHIYNNMATEFSVIEGRDVRRRIADFL